MKNLKHVFQVQFQALLINGFFYSKNFKKTQTHFVLKSILRSVNRT